jgi:hypothetical protein
MFSSQVTSNSKRPEIPSLKEKLYQASMLVPESGHGQKTTGKKHRSKRKIFQKYASSTLRLPSDINRFTTPIIEEEEVPTLNARDLQHVIQFKEQETKHTEKWLNSRLPYMRIKLEGGNRDFQLKWKYRQIYSDIQDL